MILRQCFGADFLSLAAGLRPGYSGPPYALVRFADGEAGIMQGRGHVAKSDGWEVPSGRCWETCERNALPRKLADALVCDLPGYCVGLTAEEHHPADHNFLEDFCDEFSGPPASRRTFAEIFLFANWPRFRAIDISHCCIVGPGGDIDVPRDAITSGWPWWKAVTAMMNVRSRPILVAAGPLANVIIHDYWRETQGPLESIRQTIIDAGSALSYILHPNRRIRSFQKRGDARANWVPKWKV